MELAELGDDWFVRLVRQRGIGDIDLVAFESDPFLVKPPRSVRAVRNRYAFTSPSVRAEAGC